jgi:hypothetical protein
MKYCLVLALLLVSSCQQEIKDLKEIHPGSTSLNEALQILEGPGNITRFPTHSDTQIFHWEEFSLQVNDKLVTAIVRNPTADEKSFLYWRHAYRHAPTKLQKLEASPLYQFLIPQEGLEVIYDEELDEVTKVVRYEHP